MKLPAIFGRRLLAAVPILLFLTAIVFLLSKMSGIDPARAQLGPNADYETLVETRQELWLDRPVPLQYLHYIGQAVQGDLGYSVRTHTPVSEDLSRALPATLELTLAAGVLVLLFSLVLGITSAMASRGSGVIRLLLIGSSSVPLFLTAIGAIYIFYGKLQWLPSGGRSDYLDAPTGPTGLLLVDSLVAGRPVVFFDALEHLVMPAMTLALLPTVAVGRVLRSSLHDHLSADYVRTARSYGLTERAIIFRHALRNALTAPLAMLGLQLGLMFAGVVIVEAIFSWPGIGQYAAQSIPSNDFAAIAAVTLIIGTAYIVLNALVDVLQAAADPRIEL